MSVMPRSRRLLYFPAAMLLAVGCTSGEDNLIEEVTRVRVLVAVEEVPRRISITDAIGQGLIAEREQEEKLTVGALRPDVIELRGLAFIDPVEENTRIEANMVAAPDEFGNVGAKPDGFRYIGLEALASGDVVEGDWRFWCFGGVSEGTKRFLIDRPIDSRESNRSYMASDFPPELEAFVMNDEANDGPAYNVYNITMQQLDDETIEMRNPATGELVGNFVLDTTDPADWEC